MELRVNGEAEAIETPTGRIPKYADLAPLFKTVLGKEYTAEDYQKQFTVRIPEHIAKIDRISEIYRGKVADAPPLLFDILDKQKQRLLEAKAKLGDYITPDRL